MITWLRNADDDEAEFFALIAAEAIAAPATADADPDLVRVAVHDGQVSGFAGLRLRSASTTDAELGFIFVHERWRRLGVGRLLLSDIARSACLAGADGVSITAHPSSHDFFTGAGAVRIGTRLPRPGVPWSSPVFRLPGGRDVPLPGPAGRLTR